MSISISHMKYHSISVYQARYANSIVDKYLDTSIFKTSTKFYNTTLTYDTIFTKADSYSSDNQAEKLNGGFNIHYRACIGSLIYLLYTRADLIFSVHKLATFLLDPGKVRFDLLVHLLIYMSENKTLVFNYYADVKDAPLYNLLRKANIKTDNQLMAFSDSSWQDFPDTGRSTGAYIIFYQGRPIYHGAYVPRPVAQSSVESEYNAACTSGMAFALFRMLID